MGKKLNLFVVCFLSLFSNLLFSDECPKVTPDLIKLLSITGVENDGTFDGIVEATQKSWLRPKDKERWQIPHKESKEIIDLASKMGFIHTISPSKSNYRTVVVFGATLAGVKTRLDYLKSLWKKGLRYDKIFFLTGGRPLDPQIENMDTFAKSGCPVKGELPKNEEEMMVLYYECMDLPKDMRSVPLEVITVKMPDEGLRPSTRDTLRLFTEQNPKIVSALFISSQPYCMYQNAVVKEFLTTGIFETVGVGVAKPYKMNANVVLDSIAAYLFFESKVCKD